MSTGLILVLNVIGSALISLIACRLVIQLGLLDITAEERKVQVPQTPSSGGIAIAIAVISMGLLSFYKQNWCVPIKLPFFSIDAFYTISIGGVMALILGFLDDTYDIQAGFKLLAQIFIAVCMAFGGLVFTELHIWPGLTFELGPVLGISLSLLWLISIMNFVNFMDGANGLAMSCSAIMAISLAILIYITGAVDIAFISVILGAALIGFLYWNISGKLFAGDAGAYFVGFILAAISLTWVIKTHIPIWVPLTVLSPFLVDTITTLIWRITKRESIYMAHCDHIYQIAIRAGMSHVKITGIYAFLSLQAGLMAYGGMLLGEWGMFIAYLAQNLIMLWLVIRVRYTAIKIGLLETGQV